MIVNTHSQVTILFLYQCHWRCPLTHGWVNYTVLLHLDQFLEHLILVKHEASSMVVVLLALQPLSQCCALLGEVLTGLLCLTFEYLLSRSCSSLS